MRGHVIQSSGPLRLAIVEGLNVSDSRLGAFARATKRVAIGDDDGNHWSTLCCRRYHQQAKRPRINGAFRFFES
jgi:hypothetical protein